MVLPVLGWTIGQATCSRSKQEGFDFGHSFLGQKISGEMAQMHSVRKLMASWYVMLLCLFPLSIGTKRTLGIRVGMGRVVAFCVQGDKCGVGAGVGGTSEMTHLITVQVIGGTLPGTLFLVTWECDRFVKRNVLFVVGLGAAIIGGASVIHMMGGCGGATSVAMSDTLCSTLCSGRGTYGTLCRSPSGRIQWWSGLVNVWVVSSLQCGANFC
jgi:hypothetical protein